MLEKLDKLSSLGPLRTIALLDHLYHAPQSLVAQPPLYLLPLGSQLTYSPTRA